MGKKGLPYQMYYLIQQGKGEGGVKCSLDL
jgi:hypothetical protein